MAIEFKLPQVAEGVETADVAELMVAEGDQIEAGQVVLEVETEKAVAEIECPHGGRVAKVHVSEGQTVRVGDVLLTIEEMATEEAAPAEAPPEPAQAPESPPAEPETVTTGAALTEIPTTEPAAVETATPPEAEQPAPGTSTAPAPAAETRQAA
ncbi:MAG: biotin/lipoyl-binding protein, partial [Planctomycetes bacterium]|nr:biotin/lipoyl-binding protein [Planctomycetota bacterium]